MACVHDFPCAMNLTLILCDYLDDDTHCELGSKLTQKKHYELCSIQQMESIISSLTNLGPSTIMPRQNDSCHGLII